MVKCIKEWRLNGEKVKESDVKKPQTDYIINASRARDISAQYLLCEKINTAVKTAAEKGETKASITIKQDLVGRIKEVLTDNGYSVTIKGASITFKW